MPSGYGTKKTVRARLWPCLSGKSPYTPKRLMCSSLQSGTPQDTPGAARIRWSLTPNLSTLDNNDLDLSRFSGLRTKMREPLTNTSMASPHHHAHHTRAHVRATITMLDTTLSLIPSL